MDERESDRIMAGETARLANDMARITETWCAKSLADPDKRGILIHHHSIAGHPQDGRSFTTTHELSPLVPWMSIHEHSMSGDTCHACDHSRTTNVIGSATIDGELTVTGTHAFTGSRVVDPDAAERMMRTIRAQLPNTRDQT